jgi:hypothetical protein
MAEKRFVVIGTAPPEMLIDPEDFSLVLASTSTEKEAIREAKKFISERFTADIYSSEKVKSEEDIRKIKEVVE